MQEYVTALPLALIGLLHLANLVAMATLISGAPSHSPGWRVVGPGGTHWFCFLGSWAFAALITWVWLFVGSGRRDAEEQMRYALVLIFAFGIGAVLSGFYMVRLRRMALRWRGTVIRWRERGRDVVQDMADFDAWRHAWSGLFHLSFRDGAILRLDLHSQNAEKLAVAINERVGIDIWLDSPRNGISADREPR
jgi:hypothetical protein